MHEFVIAQFVGLNFFITLDEDGVIVAVSVNDAEQELQQEDGLPTIAFIDATQIVLLQWGWPVWAAQAAVQVAVAGAAAASAAGRASSAARTQLVPWSEVEKPERDNLWAIRRPTPAP